MRNREKFAEEQNQICVKKDSQRAYRLFNTFRCLYMNSDLPKVMACYDERYGKILPTFDTVGKVRDWYCKQQENVVLELAKVRSCFNSETLAVGGRFLKCMNQ